MSLDKFHLNLENFTNRNVLSFQYSLVQVHQISILPVDVPPVPPGPPLIRMSEHDTKCSCIRAVQFVSLKHGPCIPVFQSSYKRV